MSEPMETLILMCNQLALALLMKESKLIKHTDEFPSTEIYEEHSDDKNRTVEGEETLNIQN